MSSIPVNQHPDFLAHIKSIKEDFSFLVTKFGFKVTLDEWVSREYTTHYQKDNLKVCFRYEPSCESIVVIKNMDMPYDEGKGRYNFNTFGKCNSESAQKLKEALLTGSGVIKRAVAQL